MDQEHHKTLLLAFVLTRCNIWGKSGRTAILFIERSLEGVRGLVDFTVIRTISACFLVFALICNELDHQTEEVKPTLRDRVLGVGCMLEVLLRFVTSLKR